MGSTNVVIGPALVVAGVLAVLFAAVVGWRAGLGTSRATVTAGVRATVQLGAVSLFIGAIVGSFAASAAFVVVMIVVAARTGGKRMTDDRSGWWAALPIAVAPLPAVAGLVAAGVVPPTGIAVIPMAGILIGGTMTATALAGRRALDELEARRGEVEGGGDGDRGRGDRARVPRVDPARRANPPAHRIGVNSSSNSSGVAAGLGSGSTM